MLYIYIYNYNYLGLAWLLKCEKPNIETDLPPFYSLQIINSRPTYLHSLTKHNYTRKPANIYGGMLCDDMGLVGVLFCSRNNQSLLLIDFNSVILNILNVNHTLYRYHNSDNYSNACHNVNTNQG